MTMKRVLVIGCVATLAAMSALIVLFQRQPAKDVSSKPLQSSSIVNSAPPRTSTSATRLLPRNTNQVRSPALARLQAKLLGTMVGRDAKQSKAFLQDLSTQRQVTLSLGEPLQGRVLSHIARGFVRLRGPDGVEELLAIEDTNNPEAIIQARGADEYQVDKSRLVQAIKGDVRVLWAQGKLAPHLEQFQLTGFTLADVSEGSFLEQAGLQANDVITSVNGALLNSLPAALSAYDVARRSRDISVDVDRHGDRHTLRYLIHD